MIVNGSDLARPEVMVGGRLLRVIGPPFMQSLGGVQVRLSHGRFDEASGLDKRGLELVAWLDTKHPAKSEVWVVNKRALAVRSTYYPEPEDLHNLRHSARTTDQVPYRIALPDTVQELADWAVMVVRLVETTDE